MSFDLRPYQKNVIGKVLDHLKENKRCCVSLATGGGKTIIFSELINHLEGRTLICVHRDELVSQTSKTLKINHDTLTAKTKVKGLDVCVSMVQTLNNRIKKGQLDINSFDNLIVDEAHRGEFMKILNLFNGNVVGFTATPNYEKTKTFYKCLKCGGESSKAGSCCKRKLKKYKENVPLAHYYKTLISGVEISELIDMGFLVQDDNFVLKFDTTKLVYNEARGDYTEESIGLVFGSDEAIKNTVNVYKQLSLNKKTIIFNPNTLVNKLLFEAMDREGYNVKMYDSNNSEENRIDLVNWFKETSDAILLNVQVFTTGFDCSDVEVVFLNKKTKSINLYLQMVGRGGRITDKIFKPSFRVIDLGGNHEDFGKWSDNVDWNKKFNLKVTKKVGPAIPAAVRTCHNCESIIAANSLVCEVCDVERVYTNGTISELPVRDGSPIIPSPKKIIDYCLDNDLETLEARKIVYNYVSEMFYNVSLDVYLKNKHNGTLRYRTEKFIKPYYFSIQKSKLKGNKISKLTHFTNETIKRIDRRYTTG